MGKENDLVVGACEFVEGEVFAVSVEHLRAVHVTFEVGAVPCPGDSAVLTMRPTAVIVHVKSIVSTVYFVLFSDWRKAFLIRCEVEVNLHETVAVIDVGGSVHNFAVFAEHGDGQAGLFVAHVHDHGRLHGHVVGVASCLT